MTTNPFAHLRNITWFPGHMATTAREMREKIKFVGTIIEVRDARIPISSSNPLLNEIIGNRQRVVAINKTDLVDKHSLKNMERYFANAKTKVFFTKKEDTKSFLSIVSHIANQLKQTNRIRDHNAMVLGIPNVGKSTIINILKISIRKGPKVARVGPLPGVTRAISCFQICEDPALYLIDSPGVMIPSIQDPELGLKLVLTGAIKDSIVGEEIIADFLLHELNKRKLTEYVTEFQLPGPVEDVEDLLSHIGKIKGKDKNPNVCARYFISKYREGKLGKFCLDPLSGPKSQSVRHHTLSNTQPNSSTNQHSDTMSDQSS